MSLKNVARRATVLFAVCLCSAQVYADSDFMKGFGVLKGLMGQVQTSGKVIDNPPQTASMAEDSVSKKAGIADAADYCNTIKHSPLVKEYVRILSKAVQAKAGEFDSKIALLMNGRLDSEGPELQDWVKASPSPTGEIRKSEGSDFGRLISTWTSLCAAQNYDNDLFLFFAPDLESPEVVNVLRQQAKEALDSYGVTKTLTKLGQDGMPITSTVVSREPLKFDLTRRAGKFTLEKSYWITMAAFALPNGLNALDSVAKNRPAELFVKIDQAIASREKKEALEIADEKEKENTEAKRIAASEKVQARKGADRNSPNGLLYQAYQAIQLVQTCYDVRQGYAAIYVSDAELSDAKQKMKKIEATLKSKINNETTDQIWSRAAVENTRYISGVKTATYTNGRNYCELFKRDMAGVAEKVLGKRTPEKTF